MPSPRRTTARLCLRRSIPVAALLLLTLACGACGDTQTPPLASPSGDIEGVALLVVADRDFNDQEYTTVRNGLVEAGYAVEVASPSGDTATGMDHLEVDPALKAADAAADSYDAVVFIGGSGMSDHFDDASLHELARAADRRGVVLGAICMAPVVLARAGILEGRQATVWESMRGELEKAGCSASDDHVVAHGRIVTADGPEAAADFVAALLVVLQRQRPGAAPGSRGAARTAPPGYPQANRRGVSNVQVRAKNG